MDLFLPWAPPAPPEAAEPLDFGTPRSEWCSLVASPAELKTKKPHFLFRERVKISPEVLQNSLSCCSSFQWFFPLLKAALDTIKQSPVPLLAGTKTFVNHQLIRGDPSESLRVNSHLCARGSSTGHLQNVFIWHFSATFPPQGLEFGEILTPAQLGGVLRSPGFWVCALCLHKGSGCESAVKFRACIFCEENFL